MKKIIFLTTLSAALLLSACNDSAEEEAVADNTDEEVEEVEEVAEVAEENEEEIVEIDEVDEEAQEAASDNFQIGDSATIDGITFTLDDAYLTDERNDSSIVDVRGVLVLDVTYENNTSNVFPAGRDIIVEVDGELARSYELEGALLADLPPGESISGKMAYGLTTSPENTVAIFEPLLNTAGDQAIFDVAVE